MAARITRLVLGLLALTPVLGTCRTTEAPTGTPAAPRAERATTLRGWHYAVEVAAALDRTDVQICFDGPAPDRLIPGRELSDAYTHDMRQTDGEALPRQGRGYDASGLGEDACVSYWVDLEGLEHSGEAGRMVGRTGDSLMIQPALWIWRPDMLPAEARATLRFSLPEGTRVSVPWPAEPGSPGAEPTYGLGRTAFQWLAYSAFGALTIDRFERAGARVELVTLDAPITCSPAGLRRWISAAIDTVALLFDGRFPRDRLQVVVLPVEGGSGTVYFGMAGRGGGPGVYVFLDDQAEAEQLPGGWTTIHELLHHGMPFIDEPWMAEGWVTYYTELMRTRAGFRTELEGWQAMAKGFGRGQRRTRDMTLAEASERMRELHVYQPVYWGGAAIALLLDVQIRLETDGARSLDDAIAHLRRCCGDAPHMWPAQRLLEQLDDWYGRPLFTRTASAVLSARDFPDVGEALAQVGVHVSDDEVRLDDDHAHAELRRSMMAPHRAPGP